MNTENIYRNIPSVNILLGELSSKYPKIHTTYLKRIILSYLESVRRYPKKYRLENHEKSKFQKRIIEQLTVEIERLISGTLIKVINATGVVLHTGLGRAPLDNKAIEQISDISRYTNLEIDLETGKRGERLNHISSLLKILTGAEDGIACNNNAAAVMLMLNSVALRKEVILSRGEMVEIGGSFRLPEVMKSSGCKLREIGTTNRTHLADYENSISSKTGAILICHTSNYEIHGFTHHPSVEEIVALARKNNLPVLYDLGSGSLIPTNNFGSSSEPEVSEILDKDVDLISFSGDKLLGGPQSGLIVGKYDWIKKCKKNHLLRALRLDKTIIKLLQQTLISYLYHTQLTIPKITTIQALTNSAQDIKKRSESFVQSLPKELEADINVVSSKGKVGSGAYPTLEMDSYAISIKPDKIKAELLGKKLRQASTPIISYIGENTVFLDLRVVSDDEEKIIIKSLIKSLQ